MQKETFFSILRTAMTLIGSFVIGRNVFGNPLDISTWQIVVGSLVTLISVIWGILDKSANIEAVQSGVRSVIISIGGLLTAAGLIKGETLDAILGFVAALIPALQSYLSKVKVQQISNGIVAATDSGKVKPAGPKIS